MYSACCHLINDTLSVWAVLTYPILPDKAGACVASNNAREPMAAEPSGDPAVVFA